MVSRLAQISVKLRVEDIDYLDKCIKNQLWASYSHAMRSLIQDHRIRYMRKRRGLW